MIQTVSPNKKYCVFAVIVNLAAIGAFVATDSDFARYGIIAAVCSLAMLLLVYTISSLFSDSNMEHMTEALKTNRIFALIQDILLFSLLFDLNPVTKPVIVLSICWTGLTALCIKDGICPVTGDQWMIIAFISVALGIAMFCLCSDVIVANMSWFMDLPPGSVVRPWLSKGAWLLCAFASAVSLQRIILSPISSPDYRIGLNSKRQHAADTVLWLQLILLHVILALFFASLIKPVMDNIVRSVRNNGYDLLTDLVRMCEAMGFNCIAWRLMLMYLPDCQDVAP